MRRDFFTAALAPRIARESEPVRSRMLLATSRHCFLRFGDFARFVNREESFGVHGIELPPLRRRTRRGPLENPLRSVRRWRRSCGSRCPLSFLPCLKRPIGLPHHVAVPGRIDARGSGRIEAVAQATQETRDREESTGGTRSILRHQALFPGERLEDFLPASLTAFSRNCLE